jgi:hypothetical protein
MDPKVEKKLSAKKAAVSKPEEPTPAVPPKRDTSSELPTSKEEGSNREEASAQWDTNRDNFEQILFAEIEYSEQRTRNRIDELGYDLRIKLSEQQDQFRRFAESLSEQISSKLEGIQKQIKKPVEKDTPPNELKSKTKQDPTFTDWAGAAKLPSRSPSTKEDDAEDSDDYVAQNRKTSKSKKGKHKEPWQDLFEKSDDSDEGETNRRNSIFRRAISAAQHPRHTVAYMQTPPSHEHIKLNHLTVPSVIKFIADYANYQHATGIQLRLPTLVSDRVRMFLQAKHASLTNNKFYELSDNKLISMIQEEVKPSNPLAFLEYLKQYVKFYLPIGFQPKAGHFKPLRDAILLAKQQFMEAYEIMAEDNEDNIPPCTNRDGGLVKLWIEMVPHEYAFRVVKQMKKSQFDNIYTFFKSFLDIVEKHDVVSRDSQSLNLNCKGSNYPAVNSKSQLVSRNDANSSFIRQGNGRTSSSFHKPSAGQHRVSHITTSSNINLPRQDSEALLSQDPYAGDELGNTGVEDDELATVFDPEEDIAEEGEGHDSNEDQEAEEEFDVELLHSEIYPHSEVFEGQNLLAISAPNKTSSGGGARVFTKPTSFNSKPPSSSVAASAGNGLPRGCFQLLFFGQCSRGADCKHSHDSQSLKAAHEFYSSKLKMSPHKDPLSRPILKNPAGGAKFSHIFDSAVHPSSLFDEPMLEDFYLDLVSQNNPAATLFSAVQLPGTIKLGQNQHLHLPCVLLDSGALHSNYISKSFVDKHREVLTPYLKPCSGTLTLGDGTTTSSYSEILQIQLSFVDTLKCIHDAEVRMCVFQTSPNDAIIGLPSIICKFSELHKTLIDSAVAHFENAFPNSDKHPNTIQHLNSLTNHLDWMLPQKVP